MYKRTPISEVLTELMRRDGNIGENELARRTKLHQPTIHRIKTGITKDPDTVTLQPLADYFGVDMAQMRGETPLPPEGVKQNAAIYAAINEYNRQLLYFFDGMSIEHKDALLMMAQAFHAQDNPNDCQSNPFPNKPKPAQEDIEQ